MLGIVTVGVVRGVPKMFRPPICRAHCGVIFAIAQLSCLLGLRIHALMHLLTDLLTQLARAYKAGNIPETDEDRAKYTINGLYKVVHGLSIAAKMYDLE